MKRILILLSFMFAFSNVAFTQWEACNNGLYGGNVQCVALAGNNIIIGVEGDGYTGGIYVSNDFGKNWKIKNNGLKDNTNPKSLAVLHNKIYAGTNNG
ncbi:MAG: hypothetical protein WCT77_04940, partial [Bacteroidota bacterium]